MVPRVQQRNELLHECCSSGVSKGGIRVDGFIITVSQCGITPQTRLCFLEVIVPVFIWKVCDISCHIVSVLRGNDQSIICISHPHSRSSPHDLLFETADIEHNWDPGMPFLTPFLQIVKLMEPVCCPRLRVLASYIGRLPDAATQSSLSRCM